MSVLFIELDNIALASQMQGANDDHTGPHPSVAGGATPSRMVAINSPARVKLICHLDYHLTANGGEYRNT